MASIWNDIEIEWKGESYTIRPTLEFINLLESKDGYSLSRMLVRMSNGDFPSSMACQIIATAINYGGGNVTADEVFEETAGISQDAMMLATTIISACMPKPKDSGLTDTKKKSKSKK